MNENQFEPDSFESNLAKLQPANPQVDTLEVMFRAGMERQATENRKMKMRATIASFSAFLFASFSIALFVWNQNLASDYRTASAKVDELNTQLTLVQNSVDERKPDFNQSRRELVAAGITDEKIVESVAASMDSMVARIRDRVELTKELAFDLPDSATAHY